MGHPTFGNIRQMFPPKVTFKLKCEGVKIGPVSTKERVFQGEKLQRGVSSLAIHRTSRSACLVHYEQSVVAENDQWTEVRLFMTPVAIKILTISSGALGDFEGFKKEN